MNHSFSQMTKRSIRSLTAAYFIFLLILLAGGCSSYTPEEEALIAEIQQQRAEKDQDFKADPNSPLLAEDKTDFAGLKYYPIDLNLRFEGSIVRYDSLVPDTIIGTKGDLRPAVKYGYFPFEYRGETYRLQIFKILRDNPAYQKYLFLGFTDQTGGTETYGGGRYIDLVENDENHYVIDFNQAYNPWCAYNPNYSCAIPSKENRLSFAVTAGEKNFKAH